MKLIKGMSWSGLVMISAAIIYGFLYANFQIELKEILQLVWGRILLLNTLVLYILFYCWVWLREEQNLWKLTWFIFVMALGSYAVVLYILIAVYRCQNDPQNFLMGK